MLDSTGITIDNQQISSFLKTLSTTQLLYVNDVVSRELSNRTTSIIGPPPTSSSSSLVWNGSLPPKVLDSPSHSLRLRSPPSPPSPYSVCGNDACKCQYFPRTLNGTYEIHTPSLYRTKLFIHGMDGKQTHGEATALIRKIIGAEATITEIKYTESKNFAFITLASHEEAARAQALLIQRGFNVNFSRIQPSYNK